MVATFVHVRVYMCISAWIYVVGCVIPYSMFSLHRIEWEEEIQFHANPCHQLYHACPRCEGNYHMVRDCVCVYVLLRMR